MLFRILIVLCPALVFAQAPKPAFEAASVKPTQHGRDANGWSMSDIRTPSPGRLEAINSSLDELIRYAYDIKDYQLSGPHWLNDDSVCFDISATAPGATKKEMAVMLQTLLAERFHLQFHRDTRELAVYNLVVAKGGSKLHEAAENHKKPSTSSSTSGSGAGKLTATGVNMGDFAYELSRHLKRPVFDQTGISGRYDLSLQYDEAGISSAIPTLGLRLESTKAPVEILVVDSIDRKPTEN